MGHSFIPSAGRPEGSLSVSIDPAIGLTNDNVVAQSHHDYQFVHNKATTRKSGPGHASFLVFFLFIQCGGKNVDPIHHNQDIIAVQARPRLARLRTQRGRPV